MTMTVATCAACGNNRELCGSVGIDGGQQPRVCHDCLLVYMRSGDMNINDSYWIIQLIELGDRKTLDKLLQEVNS